MTPRIVTPERAKEIEQRLGKATPGERGVMHGCVTIAPGYWWCVAHNPDPPPVGYNLASDAELFARASDDLRDLLHTLATVREENALLQAENTKLRGWMHELSQKREYPKALAPRGEGKHVE